MCPLERKAPLKAGKPLARGTSQLRRSELKRSSSLPAGGGGSLKRATPLKAGRLTLAAPDEVRAVVIGRSHGGWCEMQYRYPDVCQGQGTDFCHRIGQAVGGPDVPSNGLWGCRLCHGWGQTHPAKARQLGWILRSTDDPLTFPVMYRGRPALLDDAGGITYLPTMSEGLAS